MMAPPIGGICKNCGGSVVLKGYGDGFPDELTCLTCSRPVYRPAPAVVVDADMRGPLTPGRKPRRKPCVARPTDPDRPLLRFVDGGQPMYMSLTCPWCSGDMSHTYKATSNQARWRELDARRFACEDGHAIWLWRDASGLAWWE